MPGFAPEGYPCLCRWPWCGSALFWAWDGGSLDPILHVGLSSLSQRQPSRETACPPPLPSLQTTQMPLPAHVVREGSEARGGVWPAQASLLLSSRARGELLGLGVWKAPIFPPCLRARLGPLGFCTASAAPEGEAQP